MEKLTTDLSLVDDSNKRMSKENTLANESLASVKATHSELQARFSCLMVKYKDLEANFSALWETTKANPKAKIDSNASTSEGCSRCFKFDINAYKTNLEKIEELVKAKDKEINRLKMIVKQGFEGNVKSTPKIAYK